jgi:hypothetical protein
MGEIWYAEDDMSLPRPKRNHETPPSEEEDPSVFVEGVENGNRSSFAINWIDLRRLP